MSVIVAARTLGEESGWSLTPLAYQKVLYVAQMLHLGRTSRPLFEEEFQAWVFGPVVPSLYRRLKPFGSAAVATIAASSFAWGSTEAFAISDAFGMTEHLTAGQLVTFTHREGGAWERHYAGERSCSPLPNASIINEWQEFMQPSPDAFAWAQRMAEELETAPSPLLDDQAQRAFRARVFGQD